MNPTRVSILFAVGALVAAVPCALHADPAGTAFTYQGQLRVSGVPVDDTCDIEFTLYDDLSAGSVVSGPLLADDWPVINGLFTVPLDFGEDCFTGDARWLEIAVQCSGDAEFTTLSPRQELTPVPYALALPALRTEAGPDSPNLIGGYSGNLVADGLSGATIGGGGEEDPGGLHEIAGAGNFGTIGGGRSNYVSGYYGTVAGGAYNRAEDTRATVGGGDENYATADNATVGGGRINRATADNATVGGGYDNHATGQYATIPGGYANYATGDYSFAAGRQAQADHNGAFVWADSTGAAFTSTGIDQFLIRAAGGVGINTNDPQAALHVGGTPDVDGIMFPDGTLQTTAATGGADWSLSGNSGTTPGTDFLGTADDVALELHVNNLRALRIEPVAAPDYTGAETPNVIGGYSGNTVTPGVVGCTIAGGGSDLGGLGLFNSVVDLYCTVGGGLGNTAGNEVEEDGLFLNGADATVSGGIGNTASGYASTVGGGGSNEATGSHSAIGGGSGNTASDDQSTVGGGFDNAAPGYRSTVGGGESNTASHWASTIGGGSLNEATNSASTVGGGLGNTASGYDSTVGGGFDNTASGYRSTVGGGDINTASGYTSTVGGGYANTAFASRSTVGGGIYNDATGTSSTIAGGSDNDATESHSTVSGGYFNSASGYESTVGGGSSNDATGTSSTVGGGYFNQAWGQYSTVPGGLNNGAYGDYSFAAGRLAWVRTPSEAGDDDGDEGTFIWADSTDDNFISTGPDQFLVRASGGVGINTNAPSNDLTVAGDADFTGNVGIGLSSTPYGKLMVKQTSDTEDGGLAVQGSDTRSVRLWIDPDNLTAHLDCSSGGDGPLVLNRGGGNVGIGVSNPDVPLHVSGGSDAEPGSGGFLVLGDTSGANVVIDNNEIMARNNGSSANLMLNGDGGDLFLCPNAGNVGIGYTTPTRKLHVIADAEGGSSTQTAVFGYAWNGSGTHYGVHGFAAGTGADYGVYGEAPSGASDYAGYFSGKVHVAGTLSKSGGSFKIDHPLDPENKYLYHSFVESPDMMNVYNGNVVTDEQGFAEVILPEWFETINRDFRYQLTVIGQFAQAIIGEKVQDNRFTILTDKPNVEVSWQITGIRQDPWANANRIPVEEDKPEAEIGSYLHPDLYGQPESKRVDLWLDPSRLEELEAMTGQEGESTTEAGVDDGELVDEESVLGAAAANRG